MENPDKEDVHNCTHTMHTKYTRKTNQKGEKTTMNNTASNTIEILRPKAGILNQAIRRPHWSRLVLLEDVALKALFSFPA